MDAIGLKHGAVIGEALEHERNQRCILLSSHLCEKPLETARIHRAIVGRNAHSGDDDFGTGRAAGSDDADKVAPDLFERIAAQPIVASQRDDDDRRLMLSECRRYAIEPAECGFAADAGVDYLIVELVQLDALFQQCDPAFTLLQAVAGGNAVAENQYGLRSTCWKRGNDGQQQKEKKRPHG